MSILTKQEMMRCQWHQLDHMQIICTSLQTHNHASISSFNFGATVCKMVRSMLSDRSPVLSVTLVFFCQTAGWIEMKLGTQTGLGHIVLDGDPALPPPKRHSSPNFRPISVASVAAKWLDGLRCHLVWR